MVPSWYFPVPKSATVVPGLGFRIVILESWIRTKGVYDWDGGFRLETTIESPYNLESVF